MATVEAGRGHRRAGGGRAPLTVALVLLLLLAWALPAGALGPGDFTGDVTPPVLVSFSSTPASADVTSAPASFAVTLEVTDDLSGAQEPLLSYSREGSSINFGGSGILSLVSGTDLDGLWTGSFTIPAGSPAGTWDYNLSLDDNAGNIRNYDAATLSAGGFPASFTITDANSDTTGPQVTGISGPASVNVTNGPVTVYFQVTATDAQSGVSQLGLGVTSPLGNYDWGGASGGLDALTSGTPQSGVWTVQINFPQYTRSGTWSLYVIAFDVFGNQLLLDGPQLAAAGLDATVNVISDPDTQPPQFVTASVTPLAMDVHDADQTVTVTARITDNLSGVANYSPQIMLRGPTSVIQVGMGLVSGTDLDGIYQQTLVVPREAATGLWSIELSALDNVNNSTGGLQGAQLVTLGAPAALLVYNVPGPPTLLDFIPGDGSATLVWSPPATDGGAPVTSYLLTVSPGGVQILVSGSVTATTVSGLANGVAYAVTAQAVNLAGASPASASLSTVPGQVPEPPPPACSGPTTTPDAPCPAATGYWMLASDGAVYNFGDAPFLGDAPVLGAAVRLTPTPSRRGYWVVDSRGNVYSFGDAGYFGGATGLRKGEAVTSMSATPDGRGYWLFTNLGRVLIFGDAAFLGDMSETQLNGPVLDSVVTPSGRGYYMVASDGGVFAFGDAAFAGSMGSARLNAPVEALVPDAAGSGYWLVAGDGGIFAFGAPFLGSMGGQRLNRPVTGMVGSATGGGYLMVAADGGIFAFGDMAFQGSLGAGPPLAPIVAAATL